MSLLPAFTNPVAVPVPAIGAPQEWLIPTESSSATITASGATAPVTFDAGSVLGDPDLFSELPTGGGNDPAPLLFSGFGTPVTSGVWYAFPALATTDGFTAPAPSGATVDLNATAVTREFDTTMTSSVGDFWLRVGGRRGPVPAVPDQLRPDQGHHGEDQGARERHRGHGDHR